MAEKVRARLSPPLPWPPCVLWRKRRLPLLLMRVVIWIWNWRTKGERWRLEMKKPFRAVPKFWPKMLFNIIRPLRIHYNIYVCVCQLSPSGAAVLVSERVCSQANEFSLVKSCLYWSENLITALASQDNSFALSRAYNRGCSCFIAILINCMGAPRRRAWLGDNNNLKRAWQGGIRKI